MKYTLDDTFIVPAPVSMIDSRSECNPYHTNGMLPLFTAPMSSVVNLNNYKLFEKNKITPIIPRTVNLVDRINLFKGYWCAFSLSEAQDIIRLINGTPKIKNGHDIIGHILIDIANGSMIKLHKLIETIKNSFGNRIQIMAGNIANPETYRLLSNAGTDYVRVGIGTGNVCLTASNTGIYYPMASLIKECFEISLELKNPAKIIADGGIKGYSDIIKSLSLGADYVMCGSVFNKMLESAGDTTETREDNDSVMVDQYSHKVSEDFKNGKKFKKIHFGMSTKKAQKELGAEILKTSEGLERTQSVEYTMSQWVENFIDYIRSSMSYTSSIELYDFIGNVETVIVSNNSYNSINR